MFTLFKKRIVVDTSGEEIRRVTTLLDNHGIKYEVRTRRSMTGIGRYLDARAYARSNIALYKGASKPPLVYMVYVKRKDYKRAYDLCF